MATTVSSAAPGLSVGALTTESHLVLSLFVFASAWGLLLAPESHLLSDGLTFVVLSFLISIYAIAQTLGVYTYGDRRLLLNPTVFTSLNSNVLAVAFSGIFFLFFDGSNQGIDYGIDYWTNYYLLLMLVGNIGLWSGYRSQVAKLAAIKAQRSRFLHQIMKASFRVQLAPIVVLLAVSLACRLVLISSGLYGYSASEAALRETVAYRQFLTIGADTGKIALVAIALQYYSNSGAPGKQWWLFGILFYEAFFGLISGFKSQVVMPFIIVAVCSYFMRGRLPIRWIPIGIGALAIAYILIEPFRVFRVEIGNFENTSIEYITKSVITGGENPYGIDSEVGGWQTSVDHFFSTRNAIPIYSRGIKYADDNSPLPSDSPEFIQDIFFAPLLAVVPRAVWSSKPEMTYGDWYYIEVLGGAEGQNSVAMSALTYLYFAGGLLAVFLGYYVFGIYQKAMYDGLSIFRSGGALVFLGMFQTLSGPENTYFTNIISTIRYLPVLLIAQYFIFVREK